MTRKKKFAVIAGVIASPFLFLFFLAHREHEAHKAEVSQICRILTGTQTIQEVEQVLRAKYPEIKPARAHPNPQLGVIDYYITIRPGGYIKEPHLGPIYLYFGSWTSIQITTPDGSAQIKEYGIYISYAKEYAILYGAGVYQNGTPLRWKRTDIDTSPDRGCDAYVDTIQYPSF